MSNVKESSLTSVSNILNNAMLILKFYDIVIRKIVLLIKYFYLFV